MLSAKRSRSTLQKTTAICGPRWKTDRSTSEASRRSLMWMLPAAERFGSSHQFGQVGTRSPGHRQKQEETNRSRNRAGQPVRCCTTHGEVRGPVSETAVGKEAANHD